MIKTVGELDAILNEWHGLRNMFKPEPRFWAHWDSPIEPPFNDIHIRAETARHTLTSPHLKESVDRGILQIMTEEEYNLFLLNK